MSSKKSKKQYVSESEESNTSQETSDGEPSDKEDDVPQKSSVLHTGREAKSSSKVMDLIKKFDNLGKQEKMPIHKREEVKKEIEERKVEEKKIEDERSDESEEESEKSSSSGVESSSEEDIRSEEEEEKVESDSEESEDSKELNILVLGQTGVGKSTWINGMMNYLIFPRFSRAEREGPIQCAHSTFSVINEDFEIVEVNGGHAAPDGGSVTQECKTYVVKHEDFRINIIDTPGVGDTRGIEQDRINLQMILDHIKCLKYLHGICILTKPNEARMTPIFRFCLQELLRYLHKDASKNIIFCLTNSRSTMFRPGETVALLQDFMKEIDDGFVCNANRTYSFDNESFRYLLTFRLDNISYSRGERRKFKESFSLSSEETFRLIDYIQTLSPHKVRDTVTLNDARRIVLSFIKPLADITGVIEDNISKIDEYTSKLTNLEVFPKELYIPKLVLIAKKLQHPRTVCTSPNCIKNHKVRNTYYRYIEFSTICCDPCDLKGVLLEVKNNVKLLGCEALKNRQCTNCGCSWENHMHTRIEHRKEERNALPPKAQKEFQKKVEEKEKYGQLKKKLEKEIQSLEKEKNFILTTSAKFGHFLTVNSLTPFNDSMEDYIGMLIEQERQKPKPNLVEKLRNSRKVYRKEFKFLEESMKGEKDYQCKASEIYTLTEQLYKLKIMGKQLKDTITLVRDTEIEEHQRNREEVTKETHARS